MVGNLRNSHLPVYDENVNPCIKERLESQNCLTRTNYSQEECQPAFENYKICLKFWGKVKRYRNSKGIVPSLPPPEERKKIKEDYFSGKLKF